MRVKPTTETKRRDIVLQTLRDSAQPRSIISLAEELDVHPNTVRFHIESLLDSGRIEQLTSDTGAPGRPPTLFRVRKQMDPDGPTNYRLLATILAGYLADTTQDPDVRATELGRAWGPTLVGTPPRRTMSKGTSVVRLVELLTDLGFKPETPLGRRTQHIRLRHCPFHDVVGTYGTLICSVHLGLMQGALSGMRAPVTVNRLSAFEEADLCVAHLATLPTVQRADAADPLPG